jgi:capsular polysaccharide transport system permease protein
MNATVEEYQRLEMSAKFAEDVYKTALVALEKGRVEALRTLKKVAILQSPSMPDYPLEPRRIYNIVAFTLAALLLAGIVHLLAAIIRDHRD